MSVPLFTGRVNGDGGVTFPAPPRSFSYRELLPYGRHIKSTTDEERHTRNNALNVVVLCVDGRAPNEGEVVWYSPEYWRMSGNETQVVINERTLQLPFAERQKILGKIVDEYIRMIQPMTDDEFMSKFGIARGHCENSDWKTFVFLHSLHPLGVPTLVDRAIGSLSSNPSKPVVAELQNELSYTLALIPSFPIGWGTFHAIVSYKVCRGGSVAFGTIADGGAAHALSGSEFKPLDKANDVLLDAWNMGVVKRSNPRALPVPPHYRVAMTMCHPRSMTADHTMRQQLVQQGVLLTTAGSTATTTATATSAAPPGYGGLFGDTGMDLDDVNMLMM